ncbi:MAG TPA: SIS domain-containing protein [Vitreimonas sp.]|nr:SIS domain-containing protein [Vitreimonas sp.]
MTTSLPLLDNREEIAKLDVSNALGSIEQLGSQVQQIWEEAAKLQVDPSYAEITSVVVAGMGGSALGTHVIQTVFKEELKVPVLIAPDYSVPNFVNEKTLVIASSYSGTTEETLAAVVDAQQKGAKIAGITSGGKLAEFLKANNYPALVFDPVYNPCKSPRMALGYSVFGQIALFAKVGLLNVTEAEYQGVMNAISQAHLEFSANVDQNSNQAKLLAFELHDRVPVVTISEHLEGVAHVFANQLNENSKTFAEYRVVPELNHHLMEGLQFPKNNEHNLLFVTAHSDLYGTSNQRRMELTEQVLEQNHIEYRTYQAKAATKLEQAFEFLVFGSYTSFYLALLNNQNPTPNPWVDWFKAELKK